MKLEPKAQVDPLFKTITYRKSKHIWRHNSSGKLYYVNFILFTSDALIYSLLAQFDKDKSIRTFRVLVLPFEHSEEIAQTLSKETFKAMFTKDVGGTYRYKLKLLKGL